MMLSFQWNWANITFCQRNSVFGSYSEYNRHKHLPLKKEAIKVMKPPRNTKQVWAFLDLMGYYCKFIKTFAHMAKPLTTLTPHDAKFTLTQMHQTAFETLKGAIPKTAFTSPFSKYEYLKVPFGLAQAPAYFQKLINKVLKDLPLAIAYLDDIIIFSNTAEEHLKHLQ